MAEQTTRPDIDKRPWGAGPWQDEPDRVEWEHAGLPCLALRNHYGNWCGYAAVPPGHPLHRKPYDEVDVSVHGGLTYASLCADAICHVPKPGEPEDVWWFGFDCGHAGDFSPQMHAFLSSRGRREQPYDHAGAVAAGRFDVEVYRTLDYVQDETNHLAEQLVVLGQAAPLAAVDPVDGRVAEVPRA